jgi:hypothetical protein
MRILIPGGSGQVGTILARHLTTAGHEVVVLTRHPASLPAHPWRVLPWDGLHPGPWVEVLHHADAVIHLSGRTVNTRYTPQHRREILDSRILPTLLLGQLIAASPTPPRLWLNASTATIYRHALDHAQDEFTGEPGDRPSERGAHEPASLPETFSFSVDVGHRWEEALAAIPTPRTRRIALRTSLVMSPDPGGVFRVLSRLARFGLGGTQGSGDQRISWMHDLDYARAIDLLLAHPEIADETGGIINLAAPDAPANRDFMRSLRRAWHQPIGLPAAAWMLRIGMAVVGTEPELVLKSRWVAPALLLRHGFTFTFPDWPSAAADLVHRARTSH